jgi:hypothetical protein
MVGATAIYIALRNNSRQLGSQIFLAYADRIHKLRATLPPDIYINRLSAPAENEEVPIEERRAVREAFYLVFEFYELRRHRYVATAIWMIWERDMQRLLNSPRFTKEWPTLRYEFRNHPHFSEWVEQKQSDQPQDASGDDT